MKFLSKNYIDFKKENLNFYQIMQLIKKEKLTVFKPSIDFFSTTDADREKILEKISEGYPIPVQFAFEDFNGKFKLFANAEFLAILSLFINDTFTFRGLKFLQFEDPGMIEAVDFEIWIVKPSDQKKFNQINLKAYCLL